MLAQYCFTSFRAISNSVSSVTFLPNKLSNHLPPIIAVKIVRSPCGKLHESKTTPSNGEFWEEGTRNPKASCLNFCPVHSKFTSPTVTHSMDMSILARSGCAFSTKLASLKDGNALITREECNSSLPHLTTTLPSFRNSRSKDPLKMMRIRK